MPRRFLELRLPAFTAGDELVGDLAGTGLLGAAEEDGELRLYWPEEVWNCAILEAVRESLIAHDVPAGHCILAPAWIEDRDWNAAWVESIRPIRVGRRLLIRQTWNPVHVQDGMIELVVDPKRAFGSGYHATTQLLLEWLEDSLGDAGRVIDVGTGSGILAMAALRLGAAQAVGIDSDPDAIECARENAAANGFGGELLLAVARADGLRGPAYDLVLANLDLNTLLRCSEELVALAQPEGRILVSGLQSTDSEEISEAFARAGASIRGCRDKAGWIALEFRSAPRATQAVRAPASV